MNRILNTIFKLNYFVLGAIGLPFLLGSALLAWSWFYPYDNLHGCSLTLSSDQESYQIGDSIRLTLRIQNFEDDRKVVRMYRDHRNLLFWSRPSLVEPVETPSNDSEIVTHDLNPTGEAILIFIGKVSRVSENELAMIFPDFRLRVPTTDRDLSGVSVEIGATVTPVHPHPLDSGDNWTTLTSVIIQRE